MVPTLHDIRKACPRVLGGLKTLQLVDPNDLQTQPGAGLSPGIEGLNFKVGKRAYVFEQDRFSGSLDSDTDTSHPAGDFLTWRLTATVRNVREEVDRLRAKLLNRRIHVLATYQDNFQRVVPWMHLSAGDTSGKRATDRQGYTFSGLCRTIIPTPAIYTPISPDPDPGGGGSTGTTMTTTTSDPTVTVSVPAGKLLKCIAVNTDTPQTLSLGTTPDGIDLLDNVPVLPPGVGNPGWPVLGENLLYAAVETDIYFSGLSGSNTIILFFETVS